LSKLPKDLQLRLHITIGTKEPSIPPVEAMDLVHRWRSSATSSSTDSDKGKEKETEGDGSDGKGGKVESIALKGVVAQGRLKGLMS
jgi:hypothetical protein